MSTQSSQGRARAGPEEVAGHCVIRSLLAEHILHGHVGLSLWELRALGETGECHFQVALLVEVAQSRLQSMRCLAFLHGYQSLVVVPHRGGDCHAAVLTGDRDTSTTKPTDDRPLGMGVLAPSHSKQSAWFSSIRITEWFTPGTLAFGLGLLQLQFMLINTGRVALSRHALPVVLGIVAFLLSVVAVVNELSVPLLVVIARRKRRKPQRYRRALQRMPWPESLRCGSRCLRRRGVAWTTLAKPTGPQGMRANSLAGGTVTAGSTSSASGPCKGSLPLSHSPARTWAIRASADRTPTHPLGSWRCRSRSRGSKMPPRRGTGQRLCMKSK